MIKRRYYKQEHVDGNDVSDSNSSSSDSDSEAEAREEESDDEVEAVAEVKENEQLSSPSSESGYEREDSSGNEVDVDSSGFQIGDEDASEDDRQNRSNSRRTGKGNVQKVDAKSNLMEAMDSDQDDFSGCILKCNSVYKCRLCPRIVCLNEETLKAHLKSKRHARSEKLLGEGRLKLMLNSDGELEEDLETHAERHARTVALAEDLAPKKKNKGRQRQRERKRKRLRPKKKGSNAIEGKAKESMKNPSKKRRKNKD